MIEFGIKEAKQTKRPPDVGCFSLDKEELDWVKCREQFAKTFQKEAKGIYFSHADNEGKRIAFFLSKFEDILIEASSQTFEKSKYSLTNLNFALWIEPSQFWMECTMRRSLLTILLRCGQIYDEEKNNFEEALFSIDYAKNTKTAIQRFLFGYTTYVPTGEIIEGISKGWSNTFGKKPDDMIRKHLAITGESEKIAIGCGSLWN